MFVVVPIATRMRSLSKTSLIGILMFMILILYHVFNSISSASFNKSTESQHGNSINDSNYQGLAQEDPILIDYIRTLLRPPSTKPYNLAQPKRKHFTFMEQSKFVGNLYGAGKRDCFFVEVGALDGEGSSSTLYLERELGFRGLLIEPNPANYKRLLTKERKAYTINAALSPTNKAEELIFSGSGATGSLTKKESSKTFKVKSFPFYSIVHALNISFIDVFNLDIEGFEFKVLKTIPWDKLKFGIFIVEHLKIPEPHEDVVKYMEGLGYVKIHQNSYDYIFASQDYLDKIKKSALKD